MKVGISSNQSNTYRQGMTDRQPFDRDRDRRSFFRDPEVIGDLHLKKRWQGDCNRKIW